MTLTRRQRTTLADMLTYCRPAGADTEHAFIDRYLKPFDPVEDTGRNLHVIVGESPILWSSHTDTVHHRHGYQTLHVTADTIRLSKRSRTLSGCLGADDTVGVFLMTEMIKANVPGRYVFHYGEEIGGVGSETLADDEPYLLDGIQFAIALDRAGTGDVVTSQFGYRCCSDAFGRSLAAQLPGSWDLARGVFTDTANYTRIVPECTNLSVGYYRQHSPDEHVDLAHVGRLLHALCRLRVGDLACERNPAVVEIEPRRVLSWPMMGQYWREPYAVTRDDDWCHRCDAPIFRGDDLYLWATVDHCVCRDDDDVTLTDDDRAFLAYLRGI